jgi:hypothetical protein
LRPRKASLAYFKPYALKAQDGKFELRFKPGEIDFVVYFGPLSSRKSVGLEVKRSMDGAALSLQVMQDALKKKIIKRGIILYGGMPRIDEAEGLIYWPWWLV